MAFRVLVLGRRDTHRRMAAIKARTATAPRTPPTILRLPVDEPTATEVDVEAGEEFTGVVELYLAMLELGRMVKVEEDGRVEDCDGITTQDTSVPLKTLNTLDSMSSVAVRISMRYHP